MYISKETCKDLDTLYGQFFNLNSLFDRAVSVMLNDWAMVQASDIIHHRLAHLFPLMADMVSEIKDNYDDLSFEDVNITCTSDGLEGVEYQVIVSVTDSNNNSSQATFTYYINDTTPPSVTVRDTVYLEKGRKYTTDELISILRAAGLISNDALSVNILQQELVSSANGEDVYTLSFEQVMSDGTLKQGSVTLKYQQKTNTNYLYYIIGASSIIILSALVIIIKKRKKKIHVQN